MTRSEDLGTRNPLAIVAGWALASAMLFVGTRLPVALAAEPEKDAAQSPLTLKPGQQLPQGKWVNVLKPVNPEWDTVSGLWRRQGTDVTAAPFTFSRIMLPVELEGSYELRAEFTRHNEGYSVDIVFPVAKRHCMLNLSADSGIAHCLNSVDGFQARDRNNPTRRQPGKLINSQRYPVRIAVKLDGDKVAVDVWLDGQPLISWSGRQESLDVLPPFSLPRPFRPGLATNDTNVTFHTASVRTLDGKARMAPPHASPTVDLNDRRWIDLLANVDLQRDVIQGRWLKAGNGIEVASASQDERFVRLMFSRLVEGSYDLLAEFTRARGSDSVTFTLPVGTRQCTLHLSACAGNSGGLEVIDRRSIVNIDNPALRHPSGLVNGQRHQVLAQVRTRDDDAVIDVWLDGKPFVHWAGKQASLDTSPIWTLPERRRVGIGANQNGVTFHTVRLRPVSEGSLPAAEATSSK